MDNQKPPSTEVAIIGAYKKALAVRSEKRNSEVGWVHARQDANDRLNDALDRWSKYTGPDGAGASATREKYFMTFQSMAKKRLGLPIKMSVDDMGQHEQAGMMAMLDAAATTINSAMATSKTRSHTRKLYDAIMTEVGAVHRKLIEMHRTGDVPEPEPVPPPPPPKPPRNLGGRPAGSLDPLSAAGRRRLVANLNAKAEAGDVLAARQLIEMGIAAEKQRQLDKSKQTPKAE